MPNPKEYPDNEGSEPTSDHEGGGAGFTIFTNCNADGTYDVYKGPLMPATEADHPDGIFGLETHEESLKANIALKRQGMDFRSAEHADMMSEFEGNSYEDKTKQAMSEGY